jgi:hypothetical protein
MTRRIIVALICGVVCATFLATHSVAALAESGEPMPGGDLFIAEQLTAGSFAGSLTGMGLTLFADEAGGGTPFGGFSVTDSRDTGVGWCVTVTATRLENQTFPGKDIALDSLTMPL